MTDAGTTVKGVLLDLDGTLHQAGNPIRGASDAIAALRDGGISLRFVTNTSRRSRRRVLQQLRAYDLVLELADLFTAPAVAAAWLERQGITRAALCVPPETHEDFPRVTIDERSPEAVVAGDLGRGWTFDRLNQAFRWLLAGAELVAIQKNRYWETGRGLELDAGPFVAALEYASGKHARVVGKPSPEFFLMAVASMGLEPAEVAMVGDDLSNDVGGAQAAGLRGVLVQTGKFRPADLADSAVTPDLIVASVADLPTRLLE